MTTTSYDTVVYPNFCLPQTHPERLAVLANLHGLNPAPPERCRFLEIGCGDGANLLPQAVRHPESQFVGFDLAESRIRLGLDAVQDLGLANLKLSHCDILDFPLEGEPFDYIIAHGIYSWVPDAARERILTICQHRLAPQGVAYVSYNCLPGCHIRRMVRDVMRFHIRGVKDPAEQIRQAKAVCMLIANSIEKPDSYRQVFKEQLEQIQKHSTGHLFHDDLAEINVPFYLHEFLEHAARNSLQFLSEADFFETQEAALTPEAAQLFSHIKESRVTFEQYLDFVKGRRFRQTLLCHQATKVIESPIPAAIENFYISAQLTISDAGASPLGKPLVRFQEKRGGALEIDHAAGIHALKHLNSIWPATCSFPKLFEIAAARSTTEPAAQAKVRAELLGILLEAFRIGLIDFRRSPLQCTPKPSSRPCAYPFARWQINRTKTVTTLRGENLRVEDEIGTLLIRLLDGTRTWEELERELPEECRQKNGKGGAENPKLVSQLEELAQLALLET